MVEKAFKIKNLHVKILAKLDFQSLNLISGNSLVLYLFFISIWSFLSMFIYIFKFQILYSYAKIDENHRFED